MLMSLDCQLLYEPSGALQNRSLGIPRPTWLEPPGDAFDLAGQGDLTLTDQQFSECKC